jgi:hypothetical protein
MTNSCRLDCIGAQNIRLDEYVRVAIQPVEPEFDEYVRLEIDASGNIEEVVGMEVTYEIELEEVVGMEVVALPSTTDFKEVIGGGSVGTS